jgi:hypothetical protein
MFGPSGCFIPANGTQGLAVLLDDFKMSPDWHQNPISGNSSPIKKIRCPYFTHTTNTPRPIFAVKDACSAYITFYASARDKHIGSSCVKAKASNAIIFFYSKILEPLISRRN